MGVCVDRVGAGAVCYWRGNDTSQLERAEKLMNRYILTWTELKACTPVYWPSGLGSYVGTEP